MKSLRLVLPLLFLLAGCHGHSPLAPAEAANAAKAEQQTQLDLYRQQLELIPPPSKTRYMAVADINSWENPYITVYPGMLTLHVLLADANTSQIGVGGITRPLGARRRDISVRPNELAEAIAAVPAGAWPYGRVVSLEEAHALPAKDRPQTRRTMEATMQQLSNLGVVMYDWNDNGTRGLTE